MDAYTKPNLSKCAIITIDTQNDFSLPGAVAEIPGTEQVIPQMKRILEACRAKQVPIVHVIRLYKTDGSNVDICRRARIESGVHIASPGSHGADLVQAIKPENAEALNDQALLQGEIQSIGSQEWALYKPRWGAFYKTDLERFLREHDIDTLIFTGCNFPNCPRTSIYEASERDFKVIMIEDAISGVYAKGIEEIRNIGVNIYTTDQLIQELNSD